jgi:DNA-binding response OmpR family regulator
VDDEPLVVTVAEALLKKMGHEPITCSNGKEAVSLFSEEGASIDLVILDIVMPVLNGRDTYLKLKEIKPEVKVLLSSGFSIDSEAREILNSGVRGFIQKPFRLAELTKKIEEVLKE